MEDLQIKPAQPETPLTQTQPAPATQSIVQPQPVTATEQQPESQSNPEENFFKKNKILIIGGIVALMVITVAVGILLSLKNSEKLQGLIKARETQTQTQDQPVKIPRN